MTIHGSLDHDLILTSYLTGTCTDLDECLLAFLPVVYAVAVRYALRDPEDAVYRVLLTVRDQCRSWPATGLPARVWVLGLACRQFGGLTLLPA